MLCDDCINKEFCYGEIYPFSLGTGKDYFFCDEYIPEDYEELEYKD